MNPVEARVRLHATCDSRHGSKGPFKTFHPGLDNWRLRSRVVDGGGGAYHNIAHGTSCRMRQIGYVTRGIPAVPTSPWGSRHFYGIYFTTYGILVYPVGGVSVSNGRPWEKRPNLD